MQTITEDILKPIGGVDINNLKNTLENFDITKEEMHAHLIDSHYYDFDGTVNLLSHHGNKFKTLTLNVECLPSKHDKLTAFLSMLSSENISFDAICIQETWLPDPDKFNYAILEIPGYQLIPQGYRCGMKGGLVIYLRDCFQFKLRNLYKDSKHWEGLFIDILCEKLPNKITLANIYRPPRDNYSNASIDNFLIPISKIIKTVKKENSSLVWAGDFNINLLQINEREKFQEYFDLFATNGLLPQILLPTRLSKKKGTLIDQIFCKINGSDTKTVSGIIVTKISDHLPSFSCIDVFKRKFQTPKLVKKTTNSPEAVTSFKNAVQHGIANTHFENELFTDPTINHAKLDTIIQDAREKYLPEKTVKFNKYKHKLNPWTTQGILHSTKFRDKLYKKLRSTDHNSVHYDELETRLKAFCSTLQKTKRAAKIMYYQNLFDRYRNDIRKTWTAINQLTSKKSKRDEFPKYFIHKGKRFENDKDIANCLNTFFTNIGPELSKSISPPENKSYKDFLREKITFSFDFKLVSNNQILTIINKLKPKSSFGFDNISTILLKSLTNEICNILTLIVNQSLSTGIFPDKLKIAKIKPVFKKDDPHLPDNYRPVSLLPAISKVFEKVAFIQVYDYFTTHKLLYENQYGFRTMHSTELAGLELADRLFLQLDKKKFLWQYLLTYPKRLIQLTTQYS